MDFVVRHAAIGCLWLSFVADPVWAQVDRMGGPVEFRSADRPISTPTLRSAESASSDVGKSLPTSPPTPDDVLKQIDKELGRSGTRSTTGADRGSLGSPEKADDTSGLGKTTLK